MSPANENPSEADPPKGDSPPEKAGLPRPPHEGQTKTGQGTAQAGQKQPSRPPRSNSLDLTTKPAKSERIEVSAIPPYSARWAEVVRPLTRGIFTLLAAVLLIPFLFAFVADAAVRTAAYDWAKTILAPVVGFASAAVGYYYGTRSVTEGNVDINETEE